MSHRQGIFFQTFGCKVNQYESAWLLERFLERGYVPVDSAAAAGIVVINTCTVTSKSAAHCRQAIRKITRENPEAGILVTGCYARLNPGELTAIKGVEAVFTQNDFRDILHYRDKISPVKSDGQNIPINRVPLSGFPAHCRAFVKIQDGCDSRCSYCIVPQVRGDSRSRSPESIMDEIGRFQSSGYREVVLTGVHLGAYGGDLPSQPTLANLLENLLKKFDRLRFRLSSIEPGEVDEKLLELLNSGRLCPHLHLPLQSASPKILKLMNRPYTHGEYARLVEKILKKNEKTAIGTDIMVGFPAESEADFQKTKKFVESFPFAYLHVFVYSIRPGTPAAAMEGHILPPVKKERGKMLRDISKRKHRIFIEKNLNTVRHTMVLNKPGLNGDGLMGLTDNYIRVFFQEEKDLTKYSGEILPVRLCRVHHDFANAQGVILW